MKWLNLSIIGALTSDGRVFQHTVTHAVRATGVVAFLGHLLRHVQGELVVVLDRAGIHRAKAVQRCVQDHPRLSLVYLPPYAPDLNPVEWLWAYLKRHVLGNFVARDLRALHHRWKTGFDRVRRRSLVGSFLSAGGVAVF